MRLRDGKQLSVEQVDADSDKVVNIDVNKKIQKQDSKDKYADIEMESLVANLEGDYKNVFLLLLLYVLQGIPLGMAGSIPMILQNKNISYKQQAVFSFVYWPFSLKLLWAPIVDAVFYERFGRRKSWLVPVQYLIGLFMIMLSMKVDAILNSDVPNVLFLTVIFFALNFLAATQDIAVDGWALTMLEKRNVGYASTCNSVGQTAGYFIGNVVLLAFSSADFCNKYIRTEPQDLGMITLPGFLFFWGVVFLLTTTLVWIFKHEKIDTDVEDHGVVGTYLMLLKIVKLPAVQELIVVLLTVKIGFSAADAVTGLKLIEAGVKKETLALLAVPLVPLQILLPLVISKFTAGPRPLDVFKRAVPFRLFMGGIFALVVYWTNHIRPEGGQELPHYYFAVILFIYGLHQVTLYSMFVSIMAFFAKVSDPKIGGTYMTLLNTISNLGGNWPATLVLWLVDPLSMKECTVNKLTCADLKQKEACTASGGTCETVIDGYYIESSVCIVLGFLWLLWRRHSLTRLQNMREKAWKTDKCFVHSIYNSFHVASLKELTLFRKLMSLILPGVNFFRRNLSSVNGLKVLFFGTDDFGVSILDALNKLRITSSKIVQLDVVASTRVQLVNRRNEVILPSVLQYAEAHQLRDICWKTVKVKQSFDDFYDLAVVASFGDFIPSSFISMFSRGAINIHPSLLPRWRGAAPLVHTLLAADKQTGVSVIELSNKKFDVGRILHQDKIQVPYQCTYEQLFTRLSKLSADLIPYVVDNFDDLIKNATEQNEAFATHAPKVDKKSGRINFKCHKCADTDRMQRALPKKLGLSSYWNGMQIKIGDIRMDAQTGNDSAEIGTCRYDKKSNSLALKMKDGWIYFESVKVQNRKKISARSFYNGYIVNKNTRDENEIKFENFPTG